MKPIYYDSQSRLTNRIIKLWDKRGFKYNQGHVQLIKYSWICKLYYANLNGLKMAKINKQDTKQLNLF